MSAAARLRHTPPAYSHQKGATLILIGERNGGGGLHLKLHDRQAPGQPVLRDWPTADLEAPEPLFTSVAGVLGPAQEYELRDLLCKVRDELTPGGPAAAPVALPDADEGTALRPWPTLGAPARHGLAGEFVALVEPASEADPVAILLQFLVAFGNALNRGLYFRVEAARHCGNLFAAIVGQTSKGRKGTSWDQVLRLMRMADDTWSNGRVVTGLSSGEGLLFHVRDPVTKRKARKDREGKILDYQDEVEDPGEPDKRLLVLETEFAKVLRAMKRDTSILSGTLRQAWDDGSLRTLTKNSPLTATDAHISIIAHITGDELRSELDRTDMANGFLNRFLLACVRRSKCLPEGGDIPEGALVAMAYRVREALNFGRRIGEITRDPAARRRWAEVYPALSEGKLGMLGSVTSRAEAQVTRLSLLYAVLDLSSQVGEPHLEAALALWAYCEESARYLFGDSLGEPLADKLCEALRTAGPSGLTRTQITREILKGHGSKQEIDRALQKLVDAGVGAVERERTGGRDIERWSLRSLGSLSSQEPQFTRWDAMKQSDSEESEIRGFPEEAISLGYGEECEESEPSDLAGPPVYSDGGAEWEPPDGPPEEDGL